MIELIKTVGMVSLGCSKNRVDSELMLGKLADAGYEITPDPADADAIIVNTCGFIDPAKEESIDTLLEMAGYKKSGRCRLVIATGCLVQRYSAELKAEMPEIDAFVGVRDFDALVDVMRRADGAHEHPVEVSGRCGATGCGRRVLTTPSYSAYVRISEGCDNRCTYCAIPLIRGGYHSRPYDEVMDECRQLAAQGVTEITLIAQDTSRYGNDFEGGKTLLASLLHDVAQIEGVHWVRVLYTYPDTVDEHLIETLRNEPKVCEYLDLPLQHINARLLKRMNRRGNPDTIRALLRDCRARGMFLRTTFIVGFPGETEEEFEELKEFVKEIQFDRMGAFTYSPEEGTPAASMPDQIPEEIKQRRLDELMTIQQQISLERNKMRVGKTYEVLVEGFEGLTYYGRSMLEAPEIDGKIFFISDKELEPGDYVKVKITGAEEYDLQGVCE